MAIFKPKTISWDGVYAKNYKTPYGTEASFELAQGLFDKPFKISWESSYSLFKELYPDSDWNPDSGEFTEVDSRDSFDSEEFENEAAAGIVAKKDTTSSEVYAYVVLNEHYHLDDYDAKRLIDFVSQGNYAVLTATAFSAYLQETLGFNVRTEQLFGLQSDTMALTFRPKALKDTAPYFYTKGHIGNYFITDFSSNKEVIVRGAGNRDTEAKARMLMFSHGKGHFIICSTPIAFTNYHALDKKNAGFIERAFSLIPSDVQVLWDEYYKLDYQNELRRTRSRGTLAFIGSQAALTWAWGLLLAAGLIYTLFEIKRKQRTIPILKPHTNSSLEFVETIGQLYFQSGEHKNIAEKRINVLMEFIRKKYSLKTNHLDGDFIEKLSARSGVAPGKIKILCNRIKAIKAQDSILEDSLIDLNRIIEEFYGNI